MEITIRRVGKCKGLDCSGPLYFGPATQSLRKAIRKAVQDGTLKVVLNLSEVPEMGDRGIVELVSGLAYVKEQGGSLSLLNLAPKIDEGFVIGGLAVVFDIFDDEQKALEGCE